MESLLRRIGLAGIIGGGLLVLFTIIIILSAYFILKIIFCTIHAWAVLALNIYVVYSCIAFRDLFDHAYPVAEALENDDLLSARRAVQKIVGRDANNLDAFGVARAAVESLAENFVDGLLSPVFWYTIGCLVGVLIGFQYNIAAIFGILIYRMVNTLDSMVGYRNERYFYFGRVSARLDDLMNFIPARLSIIILMAASVLCKMNACKCWKIAGRDRLKHPSPNAGHAESCVAGALNLRLGGPIYYSHELYQKSWLGDGTADASYRDVKKCSRLVSFAGVIAVISFDVFLIYIPILPQILFIQFFML
jgi:adenosylcobinamide-phosphate synthase